MDLILINEIMENCDWRMKNQIADFIVKKAAEMTPEEFGKELTEVIFSLLNDRIAIVRTHAADSCEKIAKVFGSEEIAKLLDDKIRKMFMSIDYHIREIAISVIVKIDALEHFSDVLEEAAKDAVPNVRLVMARTLDEGQKKYLSLLASDEDPDVKALIESKLKLNC